MQGEPRLPLPQLGDKSARRSCQTILLLFPKPQHLDKFLVSCFFLFPQIFQSSRDLTSAWWVSPKAGRASGNGQGESLSVPTPGAVSDGQERSRGHSWGCRAALIPPVAPGRSCLWVCTIAVLALPPLPGHRAVPSCGHISTGSEGCTAPGFQVCWGHQPWGHVPGMGERTGMDRWGRGGPFPRDHIKMSLLCKAEGMPPRAGFHGNCKCQVPCGE